MKAICVVQGSPEWQAFRAKHFTASEAAAMMGASKYMTRDALLKQKATGFIPEVDPAKQRLFDAGHAAEASARQIAEELTGEELFPATATDDEGYLLASFDGITMSEDVIWEHKLFNIKLAQAVENGEVPETHFWQIEQQLLVSGAKKCLFMVSDGTRNCMAYCWYEASADPTRRAALIAGWKQFDEDLKNYVHVEQPQAVKGAPVIALPAVMVQVTGAISITDNFKLFEVALRDFVGNRLIRTPQTDQEFADLGEQIKSLKKAEAALDAAEASMLSQVASVDAMKRTKDLLHKLARDNRLIAEKLLTEEKENRRMKIITDGAQAITEHVYSLTQRIGIMMPAVEHNIKGVTKGLRSIDSMLNAVNTEVSRAKIAANEIADRIQINLNSYADLAVGYEFLFADLAALANQPKESFSALVENRITKHKDAEREKQEAETARIRTEEQAKAQREVEQRLMDALAWNNALIAAIDSQKKASEEAAQKIADDAKQPVLVAQADVIITPNKFVPVPNEIIVDAIRDRIAAYVMRMTEDQLRRTCSYVEDMMRLSA